MPFDKGFPPQSPNVAPFFLPVSRLTRLTTHAYTHVQIRGRILEHALREQHFQEAALNADTDAGALEYYDQLRLDKDMASGPFTAFYPAVWTRGVPLNRFLDCPMHLICHGKLLVYVFSS